MDNDILRRMGVFKRGLVQPKSQSRFCLHHLTEDDLGSAYLYTVEMMMCNPDNGDVWAETMTFTVAVGETLADIRKSELNRVVISDTMKDNAGFYLTIHNDGNIEATFKNYYRNDILAKALIRRI